MILPKPCGFSPLSVPLVCPHFPQTFSIETLFGALFCRFHLIPPSPTLPALRPGHTPSQMVLLGTNQRIGNSFPPLASLVFLPPHDCTFTFSVSPLSRRIFSKDSGLSAFTGMISRQEGRSGLSSRWGAIYKEQRFIFGDLEVQGPETCIRLSCYIIPWRKTEEKESKSSDSWT